ncbi:MAG: glycosyltransferase family 2 protein [Elusimicrobia bacterium]|nr:glycosyltransferase family 2 protein [Elusimicrobiota bacterium]
MDLSISIVTYNSADTIEKCLRSIYQNAGRLSLEVFVVDNASGDECAQMVAHNFPQASLIRNSKNLYFSRAHNQAVRESHGDFLLCLNPDTEVLDGALEKMADFLRQAPEVGILGCRLLNTDGSWQPSCVRFHGAAWAFAEVTLLNAAFPGNPIHRRKQYLDQKDRDWNLPQEVDTVSGACLMIRRATLEQVGVLDENFKLYSEDIDWCYRARKAGWKVVYYPHAAVRHHWRGSTRQLDPTMVQRMHWESLRYYMEKHRGRLLARIFQAISVLTFPTLFLLKRLKRRLYAP